MATPRTCCVDKTKYEFCPHCNKVSFDEMWRTTFCSENCRELYKLATAYTHNVINSEDAKKKLSTLDVSNIDNFIDGVKSVVYELNSAPSKIEVVEETVIEESSVIEEAPVVEETPVVVETVVEESIPRIRRRGRNNIVNED